MKQVILFFLKPLSFLPALTMMYIIYSFSAQTGVESGELSYLVSYKLVEIGNIVLDKGLEPWQIAGVAEGIEFYVRKLAHFSIYFLLAVAVSFPFYVYGVRGIWLMIVAGSICVGFACLDEYHQSFVAGRGPSKQDVLIDSAGSFLGIIAVRIFCWIVLAPVRIREQRREMKRRRWTDEQRRAQRHRRMQEKRRRQERGGYRRI